MRKSSSLAVSVALLLAVPFLVQGQGQAVAGDGAMVGTQAPAFALPDYDGTEHTLKGSLDGSKGAVVIWVSTRCPVSNDYNERMISLAEKYQPKGFSFIGINSNKAEDPAEMSDHAQKHDWNFPVLKDKGNVIADKYGASVTPEVFVIDPQGVLKYHGRIDDSQDPSGVGEKTLERALDAMLEGREIQTTKAKAFGCSIKRV